MNLETKKHVINKSQKDFFEFLSDLNNFKQLMPENTDKFEVDGESFIFSLKGMPEIRLVIKEKQEFDKIVLGAASSKLNFELVADITKIDDTSSEVQLEFNGKFNAMMAMMVKRPLTSFIETLTNNLEGLS